MNFIVGAVLGTMLLIGICAAIFVFFDMLKPWVRIKLYNTKRYIKITVEKILLLKRIWKEIYHTYTSHSIEMLLQSYVYFYEKNYHDLEGWGYVDGVYNKNDLMEMYKWIKKTRPANFEEFNKVNYDSKKERFEFWGSHYQFLKYKIDNDGELKIHPVESIEAEHPETVFHKMMMKLQNDLYDLDTQKAQWIISRRKYLCI